MSIVDTYSEYCTSNEIEINAEISKILENLGNKIILAPEQAYPVIINKSSGINIDDSIFSSVLESLSR
jgi:hypothetical protein